MSRWTPSKIRNSKGGEILPMVTAYDAITGRLADEAGVPLILVGDSLAMTALGCDSTISATMEIMLHHTAAVKRAVGNAVVVADMPFLSYQISDDEAMRNAGRFVRESGADAVKLEGGALRSGLIRRFVDNGIPVMAHIGVLPQSVKVQGYKFKGGNPSEAGLLMNDAKEVEKAGAFCVVLECVDAEIAAKITAEINIPTIGIGSGNKCDGQILVIADLLGLTCGKIPKFVKRFSNCSEIASDAIKKYMEEVKNRDFPAEEYTYSQPSNKITM